MSEQLLQELKRQVGVRLKTRREGMGLPQAEIAHRMGVATSSVQRTEAGTLNPTLETLALHCHALGWKLGDLFSEMSEPPKPTAEEALHILAEFVRKHAK